MIKKEHKVQTTYDTYRDSGINWIGQIPEHWEVERHKDLSKLNRESLTNETAPFYQFKYIDISNVNQQGIVSKPELIQFNEAPSRARRILTKNDIIVSTVRTYLKAVAFINFDATNYVASTGFAVLTPSKRVVPKFLAHYCQSDLFVNLVVKNSVGASYPAINAIEFACLFVIAPPLPEQKTIAQYLDTKTQAIDKKVNLLQQKIDYYKELRKAIINQAVTKGLDKKVTMKDSGINWIGQIPEHWEVRRVKDDFNTLAGGTPSTKNPDYWEGEIPWILSGNVQNNIVEQNSVKNYITSLALKESSTKVAKCDSVLIALAGATCSNIGYLTFDTTINQSIVAIYPKKKSSSKYYFYFLISAKEKIRSLMSGGAQGGINQEDVQFFKIVVPTKKEQTAIAQYLDKKTKTIDSIVSNIKSQIAKN